MGTVGRRSRPVKAQPTPTVSPKMNIIVRPIVANDIDSFRACLDAVARETKYLAMLEAPPLESVQSFVTDNIAHGHPQFVAHDGSRVVGWCDILPGSHHALRHCGTAGLGLLPQHRGRGLGRELLSACIAKAQSVGVTRIELDVRTDNERAIRLYERLGFVREGYKKQGMRVHDEYIDTIWMALIL
jgi:RimJ/RimL family protein N-acetyltransferase